MRKTILSLVAVVATLTACTKTELAPNDTLSREVSFLAANMTKVNGDKFEEGDKVKVAAFEDNAIYKTAQYSYDGGNKFISNAAIAYSNDDQALSFFATYPENIVTSASFDFSVNTNQSTADNFESSDLLVATVEETQSLSPAFVFGHKMTNIIVKLVVKNGGSATAQNFAFNMKANAECAPFEGTYTAKANANEVKITPSKNAAGDQFSVIVPAQSVTANAGFAQVEIGGKTFKSENKQREFLSGKRYTYTWTIDVAAGTQSFVSGGEGTDGGDQGGGDVVVPDNNNTKYAYMPELPEENIEMAGNYYYAYHNRADAQSVRNFAVCYSKEKMCPVWVAAPMHACYKGSSGRNDSYKDDPKIPLTEAASWDGYTRGHMLGSSDRTISVATNKQVFYRSNIAPQLGYVNGGGFNTGGGVWNNLEDYTDGQWCSDTLYQVIGCYWANNNTKVDRTTIPTHYYKVLLRTKSGNTGKNVQNCSADELKCVAFIVEHNTKQHMVKPHSGMMRSVAEIEKMTGLTFFSNVPNAPKDSYTKSDWGM